jgi:hypothetical protein
MNPTTINPNANFFQGQGGNPSVINTTAPSTPLDASKLTNQTTVNLKPTTQTPVPDITSLMSSEVPQIVAPTAPQPKQGLGDKLAGLIGLSKGKESDLQTQVTAQTQPYAQQLNELNTQIKMQQAKAIQNQELAMQRGETTGFASREAQNIARTDAIETLKLSALAEGMRGNIALAEQQATQAINAKYADIDRQIEDAKTNIYNNYDSMSPAEKKKADATLLRLDKDDAFVKTRKEDDKITQGFLQEAIAQSAQNGTPIPSLVLQRANQAETPTEALQILAPYMVDAQAKALALEKLKGERLQNQKLQLDIDVMENPQQTGTILNAAGKPLTDAQSTSLGYANRLAQANVVINELGGNFTGKSSIVGSLVPNILKSGDRQKYEQAQRNFVNAILRQESGAAIAESEFESAQKQYFPQPGDLVGVIAQKKANRDLAYQNLLQRAGNPQIPSQAGNVTVNGQQYQVGKVYTDKTGNWVVDANGKWSKQ